MRADNSGAAVKNNNNIYLEGSYATGLLANGGATATNTGTIGTGTADSKNNNSWKWNCCYKWNSKQ